MRSLIPLLLLASCASNGVLLAVDAPSEPEPVTAVVLGSDVSTMLPAGWSATRAADMDADGIVDLVGRTGDGEFSWLKGDGRGGFEADVLVSAETFQTQVVASITGSAAANPVVDAFDLVDVDGDGYVDLQLTLRFMDAEPFRTVSGVLFAPALLPAWESRTDTPNHRVTTVADLDGDDRVEWVEFSQTPAIHTSGGQVWPLSDAVSWVYYPRVGTLSVGGEVLFVTMVDGGYGISQIETWTVMSTGLQPRPSVQGIFANDVTFGRTPQQVVRQALMVSHTGIEWFDGTALTPAVQANEGTGFFNATVGDFTGDGERDVLVSNGQAPPTLHASSGDARLVEMPIDAPLLPAMGTLVADINGDGLDDLVHVENSNGVATLSIWMNES